ncbi:hypothetical protein [Afipia carboxidovorans]|uniref:hypothetical protein n=1 Tax=Afipia carboxidovorans TaxID=40137 RepID=UPI003086F226|nr:hypothetical protein CRBSH125_09960 [Afipia carboxidovorans]
MPDLSDLISRVEKASDGDRELDEAIALTLNIYVRERRGKDRQYWFYKVGGNDYERRSTHRYAGSDGLPFYTASLDAVLTLLPEGWWWSAGVCRRENHASVGSEIGTVEGELIFETFGATAPLALLSAILRARQAMQMEART